jgi:lysophospholipase L1-like esterase
LFQGRYISSAYKIFKPFGYLKDNVWSLVISTWSRENNVGKIYINGNEATTTTNTTDTADIPVTILIGASGVSNESWSGNIGDTVLLNRYITPAESLQCFRIFLSDYSMWVGILGDSISTNSVGWHGGIFGTYNSNRTKINNHAVAGMGVIQGASNMAAQVTASASDRNNIIIIELGTNDDNAGNMTTLQASYEAGIIALKASNPLATIYALNVLPRWTDTGGGTVVDKSNIRTAIAAACTAQSITCWDTFTDPWITAAQTADGLHPTAAGHAAIAAQVLARL